MIEWRAGRAVVTVWPERGRVLQVSVDGVDAFTAGGDRLWLSPEWAWYWPDLTSYDPATHHVPPSMDPGSWHIVSDDPLTVVQDVTLRHLHGGDDVTATVSRSFALADPGDADVAYAVTARLDVRSGSTPVGLWSLVQVPRGGVATVPGAAAARDYFDPTPPGLWSLSPEGLSVRLDGASLFKLGVPSASSWAYARPVGDRVLTVTRTFAASGGPYADVPLSALGSPGDGVQVFHDGGLLGGFAECEHHSPVAAPSVVDESVVRVDVRPRRI